MMVAAWSQSAVGVCTRKLKALHFSIIMFTYAWIASLILLVFLTVDYFATQKIGTTPRIFTYSKENYLLMFGCALFNAFGMNLLTIARQSYKLAFVMIISYSTLVYAFIADMAVFDYKFNAQQLIGASIVLAFNIWAVCDKFINDSS